ncbi:hypothetical protein AAMO2058_000923100 [Amorphochlora amoebiformis]
MSCFYGTDSISGDKGFNIKICQTSTGVNVTSIDGGAALAASSTVETLRGVTDIMWILICGILIFWMQAGFALLEAGSVRKKNRNNILFKNLMDASIACFCFWLLGYSFAFGNGRAENNNPGNDNTFIGAGNWALQNFNNDDMYHNFFFQWTFAGSCATIVSGSVAERCTLEGYFIYAVVLTTFIYPVVVHWVWSGTGWLSAFYIGADGERYLKENGMIDFAGSGVIHLTGGIAGLMGAMAVGPRKYFLTNPLLLQGSSDLFCALGVSILWMGWYGFNCGSTLGAGAGDGSYINLAAKVAVTTTISAASGALSCTLYSRTILGYYKLSLSLNGVLAGLVSITAGCHVTEPWAAMVIGLIGGQIYICSSKATRFMEVDDPLDAFAVHGCCGAFGVLAVGIFATESNISRAYGFQNDAVITGNQFANQLVGVLAIGSWSAGMNGLVFFSMRAAGILRVSTSHEEEGLDICEHGKFPSYRAKDDVKGLKGTKQAFGSVKETTKVYPRTDAEDQIQVLDVASPPNSATCMG